MIRLIFKLVMENIESILKSILKPMLVIALVILALLAYKTYVMRDLVDTDAARTAILDESGWAEAEGLAGVVFSDSGSGVGITIMIREPFKTADFGAFVADFCFAAASYFEEKGITLLLINISYSESEGTSMQWMSDNFVNGVFSDSRTSQVVSSNILTEELRQLAIG